MAASAVEEPDIPAMKVAIRTVHLGKSADHMADKGVSKIA